MMRLCLAFAILSTPCLSGEYVPTPDLPKRDPVKLKAVGTFGPGARRENSGIVKSRTTDGLFWTINDSGDQPRVYPVRQDGSIFGASRYEDTPGVYVAGAINVDWEDIAVDDQGHLIVCDVGNNRNDRRDLVLYFLDEPSPLAGRSTCKRKLFFRYPDQALYPASRDDFNYDCEGVFFAKGKVYFVSKNRSDTLGKLYRMDAREPFVTNTLTYLDAFDFGGKTTGADATVDGRRLAVATYDAIWVFEIDGTTDQYFRGKVYWMPFEAPQVEAVCFEDRDTLLLADETAAEIYRVELADMERVDNLDFTAID